MSGNVQPHAGTAKERISLHRLILQ